VQDEHGMTLVTQARVSNHRRHDHDDDRRARDEHRRLAPDQRKDMRFYMQKMTGISGYSVKDSSR